MLLLLLFLCDGIYIWYSIFRVDVVKRIEFVLECFSWWNTGVCIIYSWAIYLRVQTTSLTFIVAIISLSPNSRIISDGGSPPCFWINLLPSNVITLFTVRPSNVSSSNSLPNSNEISEFLNVLDVTSVYVSPSFFNSTVGVTEFPILRSTNPTPAKTTNERNKTKKQILTLTFKVQQNTTFPILHLNIKTCVIENERRKSFRHSIGNKPLKHVFQLNYALHKCNFKWMQMCGV